MPIGYFDISLENGASLGAEGDDTILLEQGVLVEDTGSGTEPTPTLKTATLVREIVQPVEKAEYIIAGPGNILLEEATVGNPDVNFALLMENDSALLIESGLSVTDAGQATDTIPRIARTIPDTAQAVEVLLPRAAFALTETARGLEVPALRAVISRADAATGSDIIIPSARYTVADTGTSTSVEVLRALYSLGDNGRATEQLIAKAALTVVEASTGVEAPVGDILLEEGHALLVENGSTILIESGASVLESFTLKVAVASAQAGTGVDAITRLLNSNDLTAVYNVIAHASKDLVVQYLVLQMVLDDLYAEYDVDGLYTNPSGIITREGALV